MSLLTYVLLATFHQSFVTDICSRDEATLRWKGNLNLPPGSMSRTLGELVLETVEGTNEALYRPTATTESKKLASGGRPLLQLPLEVYIDRITVRHIPIGFPNAEVNVILIKFDERRQASVAAMRTTASRKRSGTESHHDITRAKRQAGGISGTLLLKGITDLNVECIFFRSGINSAPRKCAL
jgi:hypothetical protein